MTNKNYRNRCFTNGMGANHKNWKFWNRRLLCSISIAKQYCLVEIYHKLYVVTCTACEAI